jgi:hypothetical protein
MSFKKTLKVFCFFFFGYYYVKVYIKKYPKICYNFIFSNHAFSFKIVFKQWLQVIKSVYYVFFIHYIDSKFLWYVHNVFKITFYE